MRRRELRNLVQRLVLCAALIEGNSTHDNIFMLVRTRRSGGHKHMTAAVALYSNCRLSEASQWKWPGATYFSRPFSTAVKKPSGLKVICRMR